MVRIGNENCQDCELSITRKQVVKNVIVEECEIAFCGLGPGFHEDQEGMPFYPSQRSAGNELNKALTHFGLKREDVSVLNCNLCYLPDNKLKKRNWVACSKYFRESIANMPNLKIMVLLGVDTWKMVSGNTKGAMKDIYLHPFKLEEYGNILFLPNYHPAAFLHQPGGEIKDKFYKGLEKMLELLRLSKSVTKPVNYKHILTKEDLQCTIETLETKKIFSIDLETTSLKPHLAQILSIHFSYEDFTALGIPYIFLNEGSELVHYWDGFLRFELESLLREMLTNPEKVSCAQNAKYDSLVLKHNFGFGIENLLFDTMLGSFVLDSNTKNDLETLVVTYIPEQAGAKSSFWQKIPKTDKEGWYKYVTLPELLDYGCSDADSTFQLSKIMSRKLREE